MDRDCRTCIHSNFHGEDNGCRVWSCEYINREEAIEAWREKHNTKVSQGKEGTNNDIN